MAKMSEGFKDRLRDAKPETTDRATMKAYDEPWDRWISRLRFEAELEEIRSGSRTIPQDLTARGDEVALTM